MSLPAATRSPLDPRDNKRAGVVPATSAVQGVGRGLTDT